MPRAQVTHPDAWVMADGRVRVPGLSLVVVVSGRTFTEFAADTGWEVEVLPNPEPAWAEGDVVQDAHGQTFILTPSRRWREALGQDFEPARPLKRLVPEP